MADTPASSEDPGQAEAAAAAPPSRAAPDLPPGTRVVPAAPSYPPGSPGAVLEGALALPAKLQVSGAPMRLLDVLARAGEPRTRLAAIDAYWNVALAWVAAHWQWADHDFLERLDAMSPPLSDPAQHEARQSQFQSRRAAALADWRQAELDLTEAQQRLAVYVRMAPGEALPLAADLPHVGAYKTRFESLFAGRPVAERPLVIHHTLPLRERELRLRALAILAARDALDAAEAGYQQGVISLETVLACLDDQALQHSAFLSVVRKYNLDIAEYALMTPLPAADDRVLAARLIKLRPEMGWRWEPRRPDQPSASSAAAEAPIAVVPPSSGGAGQAQFQQPAEEEAVVRQLDFEVRSKTQQDQAPPPSAEPRAGSANPGQRDGAHVPAARPRAAPAEAQLTAAQQAVQLHARLQAGLTNVPQDSLPASLADCLGRAAPQVRRELIVAYWRTRQSAAQRQVFAAAAAEFEALRSLLIGLHADPQGNLTMLRSHTARLGNDASLAAVDAVLLEQRVRLSAICGQPIASAWMWPTTAPTAAAHPAATARSSMAARAGKAYALLLDRAALVAAGASARQRALRTADAEPLSAMAALESIGAETMATVDFLEAVTRYNFAVADQVLASLPAGSSGEQLIEALGQALPPRS